LLDLDAGSPGAVVIASARTALTGRQQRVEQVEQVWQVEPVEQVGQVRAACVATNRVAGFRVR